MVKLVDTLVSGTSGRKSVQVRVLFWAQKRGILSRMIETPFFLPIQSGIAANVQRIKNARFVCLVSNSSLVRRGKFFVQ